MNDRRRPGTTGRIVLAVLTLYGLAMVVPDLARVARPLGSFGIIVDNNGVIYDVQTPFHDPAQSPAWQAGLRPGDRIDLARMTCIPVNTPVCAARLTVWGGVAYVAPGTAMTLMLAAGPDRPARDVTLVAEQRPRSWLLAGVVLVTQLAGIAVVLGAAWLVWTRPGRMTWGFFLYCVMFNPGAAFALWALLQPYPVLTLAQLVATSLFQAVSYAGFIMFALRVPTDRVDARWAPLERALPLLAIVLGAIILAPLASAFGYPTETLMRIALLAGLPIDLAALAILFARRGSLAPRDFQRMRWVIWGCVIGLPAFMFAELSQVTTLPASIWSGLDLPEDAEALLFLLNGVLCLFVIEAVRRPHVISVTIPLRRATVLGLLLSIPALFLHQELETVKELVHLPPWAWILLASVLAFLISRLHELATHLADGFLDLGFRRAEEQLADARRHILQAASLAELTRLMLDEPMRILGLTSAALFRDEGRLYRRHEEGAGWDATMAEALSAGDPLIAARFAGQPYPIDPDARTDHRLPGGLDAPVLAVPIGNPRRCYAVALFGTHESGADIARRERGALRALAAAAAVAYAEIETETLRRRLAALEVQTVTQPA